MVLTAVCAVSAFAQSAEVMDSIISSEKLTYGQAAYLVFTGIERIDDETDFSEAFMVLKESGLIKAAALPDTCEAVIPLKNYAFLLMRALNIRGGINYSIMPNPRYAYRELCYYAVIQGKLDPDAAVTGAAAVQMIGRVYGLKGGKQ
ncbi:MAG: hypothetical protein ACTTH8_04750 [Treponema sp.]